MEYHKIDSVFKRDPETKHKTFTDEYARPEFEYLKDSLWTGTEKVDGTNIRIYKSGKLEGRTQGAQTPKFLAEAIAPIVEAAVAYEGLPDGAVLYGEGYGPKVQSGGHYRPDHGFVLFDVSVKGLWLNRDSVIDIARALAIPFAPILATQTLVEWVEAIKSGQFKESELHTGARNEGVVLRPFVELQDRQGRRVITKLKYKDFQ